MIRAAKKSDIAAIAAAEKRYICSAACFCRAHFKHISGRSIYSLIHIYTLAVNGGRKIAARYGKNRILRKLCGYTEHSHL